MAKTLIFRGKIQLKSVEILQLNYLTNITKEKQ